MKLKTTHLLRGTFFALSLGLCLPISANAQFNSPNGIVLDSAGNLWLANSGGNSVLEIDPTNGQVLNTITEAVSSPTRLAISGGDLYVTYVTNLGANTVTVYDLLTLTLEKTIASPAINRPLGIAIDFYGDVYIADNSANNVIALNMDGHLAETLTEDNSGFEFTAPGALAIHGKNIYAGFGGPGKNAVNSYNVGEFLTGDPLEIKQYNDNVNTGPTGVAFDSAGNVYISEYTSATAVKYKASKGTEPELVISQDVGGPEGIAVDNSGTIYVSNSSLNTITVYNSSGTLINTLR
jgi:DNA-binding beta-propeller fold protein YncE